MPRVLICDQIELDGLRLGPSIQSDFRPDITREDLLSVVGDYDGLVIRSRTKVDREVLDRAVRLKLVARPGTGLDNVDVEYAKKKGVQVVNSPEAPVEAVAEHVILLMLAMSRRLIPAHNTTKAGKWEKNSLVGREMKGKVVGIVGLGRIGRRIAEISGAMGASVLAYDVIPIPAEVVSALKCRMVGLEELFTSADYVTLHVPLTPETRHMVNNGMLGKMKHGAFLVNASRGEVVDQEALASALNEGTLGGAALDVFEKEPPTGQILEAPNAVFTPHIGGQTEEAQVEAVTVIGEKVRSFFSTQRDG